MKVQRCTCAIFWLLSGFLLAACMLPGFAIAQVGSEFAIQVPKSYSNTSKGSLTLHYEVISQLGGSSNKTLIMIPGGPGNTGDYLKDRTFIEGLRTHFRLVLIHPRGSPKSVLTFEEVQDTAINQVRNMALDVEEVRRSLKDARSVFVYGHSFGGLVGLLYSGLFPDRVSGLISHSSLADYGLIRRLSRQSEDFSRSQLSQIFEKALVQIGVPGEMEIYRTLIEQAEKKAARGEIVVVREGERWTVGPHDLRLMLAEILMDTLERSKEFLRSIVEGTSLATNQLLERWEQIVRHDSPDLRNVLYCSEFLTDVELRHRLVKQEGSLRDYHCSRYKIINRPDPIDFVKIQQSVKAPVLVVYGRYDFVTPADFTLSGFHRLSRVQLKELSRSTHYGYQTEQDSLVQAITEFATPTR